MTCAGMLKLSSVATRRSDVRADGVRGLPGGSGQPAQDGRDRAASTGAARPRRRRAPRRRPRPPLLGGRRGSRGERELHAVVGGARRARGTARRAAAWARRRCSGASEAPSMRCGAGAGAGREKSRSGDSAGRTDVRMRSLASMVGDSSQLDDPGAGRFLAARAHGLGLAARGAAGLGDALPGVRRPLVQRRPGDQQHAGDDQRDDQDVDAHAADERAEDGPLGFSEQPAVRAHVRVAEELRRGARR